jgi:hypothetical protein
MTSTRDARQTGCMKLRINSSLSMSCPPRAKSRAAMLRQ